MRRLTVNAIVAALLVMGLVVAPVTAAPSRYTLVADQTVIPFGQDTVQLTGCGYKPNRYLWVRSLSPLGSEYWNLVTAQPDGCIETWGAAVYLGDWTYTANHFQSGTVLASTTAVVVP